MDESRRHRRFRVEGMHGSVLLASGVKILNVSLGGAAVEASKRLNIGQQYTLKLHDGRSIAVTCEVVWCIIARSEQDVQGRGVPVYQAGLRFTNVLTEKASELMEFLHQYKVADEARVAGARFEMDPARQAVLTCPFHCVVRKLSLSGALIETDRSLDEDERLPMEVFLSENRPLRFFGQVRSILEKEVEGEIFYEVGIEFVDMAEEARASLAEYLDTLGESG